MTIHEQKNVLRNQIREIKKLYTTEYKAQKSNLIFQQIETMDVFKNADVIMLYWSLPDEVQTHDFILKWHTHKTIILPSVSGNNLLLKQFTGIENMIEGESHRIGEPSSEEYKNSEKIDLIIVPGVAFDKNNNRMGRGRGYYDRLLSPSNAFKVGVCFDFQFFEEIPAEDFDIKMNHVAHD
ncbi:MAG TPA: 5-formyltetrahydrofolate cyclo-ligase [Bacteroidales bacterium]|nr:5-formyltetrahydrofolate cyclo-ligase [Bacteroidales bacterium]